MGQTSPISAECRELLAALSRSNSKIVDLTAPLDESTPILNLPEPMTPIPPFGRTELARYDARGETSYMNEIRMGEHTGTHLDAPCHWITGKDKGDVSEVPTDVLFAPVVVIDKTAEVAASSDYLLSIDDIQSWQEEWGPLPRGWLLYRTGWSKRIRDTGLYLNEAADGAHTPGIEPECAKWLAQSSPIVGIGVETVGTDAGQAYGFDPPFPVHSHMLGAGKYGLTQLVNLDAVPQTGAMVIVAPLPIVAGSGSPSRVLALVPEK